VVLLTLSYPILPRTSLQSLPHFQDEPLIQPTPSARCCIIEVQETPVMSLLDRFLRLNPWTRIIVSAIFGAICSLSWARVRSHSRAPRSTCLIQDQDHNACNTWVVYNLNKAKPGLADKNFMDHSQTCVSSGGSAQIQDVLKNGGVLVTCTFK
jgi:hypothetical protein